MAAARRLSPTPDSPRDYPHKILKRQIVIESGGLLEVGATAADVTTEINTTRIEVKSGGSLVVGTTTARPAGKVIITLLDTSPSTNTSRTLQVYPGGTLELHGAVYEDEKKRCWTQLSQNANAQDYSLNLATAVNWPAGSKVVVASTDFPKVLRAGTSGNAGSRDILDPVNGEQTETVDLVTHSGAGPGQVWLSSPLQFPHLGTIVQPNTLGGVDERAEVGLLTRSIVIQGSVVGRGQVFIGDHPAPAVPSATVHVDWTEFRYLGNASLVPNGGYPFHFHETGDMTGSYVEHCSLHSNEHNNLVIHSTRNLQVFDNVFYNTTGWHVWTQEADDQTNTGNPNGPAIWTCINNTIDWNLALVARDNGEGDDPWGTLNNAACFYLRNFGNTVTNNHAGSSEQQGFYVDTIEHWVSGSQGDRWTSGHPFNKNTSFAGNVAHSCAEHGFYLRDFTEFPVLYPNANSSASGFPLFKDFTAYKNCNFGAFPKSFGTMVWTNTRLADNGSGLYFASYRPGFEAIQMMTGTSLIIGESSENIGIPNAGQARSYPSMRSGSGYKYIAGRAEWGVVGELTGLSLYDGLVLMDGVTFSKFNPLNQPAQRPHAAAVGLSAYDNPWDIDPNNAFRACTFDTGDQKVWFRTAGLFGGAAHTILHDIDGCILKEINPAYTNGVIFPNGNNLMSLNGTAITGTRAAWNAHYINNDTPFAQAKIRNAVKDVIRVNVGAGLAYETHVSSATLDEFGYFHAWNTRCARGSNTPGPDETNVISDNAYGSGAIYLVLAGNVAGSMMDFVIPYEGSFTFAAETADTWLHITDPLHRTSLGASTDMSAFLNANYTTYYFDTSTYKLYVRIVVPSSTIGGGLGQQLSGAGWGNSCNGDPLHIRIVAS